MDTRSKLTHDEFVQFARRGILFMRNGDFITNLRTGHVGEVQRLEGRYLLVKNWHLPDCPEQGYGELLIPVPINEVENL